MVRRQPPAPAPMPEIIAHRGASRECLENTMAAFARALEQQADGIELDVHATRDGELVVHHDPAVEVRHGEASERVPLARLSAAEVAAVQLTGGHRIPTLAEVFDLVGDCATVYVEVKAPRVEALVASLLVRYPQVRSAVHAFDHRIPIGVRALRPSTPIGLLSASYPLDLRGVLSRSSAAAFWQHAELIDEPLVHAAHEAGVRLIAWTVKDASHARRLAAWGVDAVCTDIPGELRRALMAPIAAAPPAGA